ncbi:hypothetical protein [Methylomonas sp. 11b]|uniref:hypothetical protein n=1 Tax=Methylomonas sp. 11b TaxID=1168169 RepID=UPI00047A0F6B|nr:hypothetical protein [Methylomonas sp. 11b]
MNQPLQADNSNSKYVIALPCEPENFASFIGSLLGKPQTIATSERGSFEIRREDIVNSYHLLVQRVQQQNEGQLLQFTVRLVFNDDSSVLLNSLDEFLSYSEVRPVFPTQAHLSWAFIVKFQDRSHPEKQDIDLSFLTNGSGAFLTGDDVEIEFVSMRGLSRGGLIAFRIRHTARTWGADIESLLSGHAKHLLLPEAPARKFVRRNSGKLAALLAVTFFVASIAACLVTANHLATEQLKAVSGLIQSTNALDLKLNRILEMNAEGFWGKYFFSVMIFIVFSLISAVALAVWTETSADTVRPSHLLLTKKAEQNKIELESRYRVRWLSFLGSVGVSIATGIVSNILFTHYWGN